MSITDDKEIIEAMRENPERGFRLLMASYKEAVYWHVRRLVVSHADAQDVAQETFVRVFRSFSQYGEGNSLKAWIFRIATNEALRLLGRQKNATMLSLDDVTADLLGMKADEHYDNSDALAARLQGAILHLPAKQQLAFNLRYYDELTYEEIATVAGSTAASAKMNYHLAKEKIIKYMQTND
jgi:RNA polymerase sigma-70 factor (ECF subfamily)